MILIGIANIPATLIVFIVKERVLKAKHMQIVSGLNTPIYWLANFTVDYLKYLIFVIATIIFLFVFEVESLNEGDNGV